MAKELPVNTYENLKLALGVGDEQTACFQAVLFDWAKAQALTAEPQSTADIWQAFLDVGFRKERVLPMVDPAIRGIVDRLLDLPVLTLDSCSGHTVDGVVDRNLTPYLYVIFKNPCFAKDFISDLKEAFHQSEFRNPPAKLKLEGCVASLVGLLGPRLPFELCLEYCLGIMISWEITEVHDRTLHLIWELFSSVLQRFDGGEGFRADDSLFEQQGEYSLEEEWVEELRDLP